MDDELEEKPTWEQCPDVDPFADSARVMGVVGREYRRLSVAYHREGMVLEAHFLAQAAARIADLHRHLARLAGHDYPDAPDHPVTDSAESASPVRDS